MASQTIEALVEGGKASAAPPLGPALGPLGVNIGQVISAINQKTESFKGMQVPIKVIVDTSSKTFEITVGTPPAAALIKKEAGVEKGSGNPLTDKVADLLIEQAIKVAKMKEDSLLGKTLKDRVKEVCGTCQSMGILVEGKPAHDTILDINAGMFDAQIKSGKTELTAEEKTHLEQEKKKLAEDMAARRVEYEKQAKQFIELYKDKESAFVRKKLREAKIPETLIKELLPEEKKAAGAGGK